MTSDADVSSHAHESGQEREEPEIVDPCGCAPRPAVSTGPAEAQDTPTGPADTSQEPPGQADTPRREVKLVVLLHHLDTGYRAHVAVGSDGCDPELRVTDVPDLATALLALSEVAAAAQAR